jgi:AraC-like DNA-binding protein
MRAKGHAIPRGRTEDWRIRRAEFQYRSFGSPALRFSCCSSVGPVFRFPVPAPMLLTPDSFRSLCHAREMLLEVPEHRLSIPDIAREVHTSPYHFIRQFHALYGMTPHQFRIESRLHHAKILLAAGEHSVTEVCLEVGFSSLGSFSDLFSRRFGTAPSTYRRRARSLVTVPGMLPQQLFPGCLSLMALLPAEAFRNFREARPAGASVESSPRSKENSTCDSDSQALWSTIRTKR